MDREEKIILITLGIISFSALIVACVALHNSIQNKNNINQQDEKLFTPQGRKVLDTIP